MNERLSLFIQTCVNPRGRRYAYNDIYTWVAARDIVNHEQMLFSIKQVKYPTTLYIVVKDL